MNTLLLLTTAALATFTTASPQPTKPTTPTCSPTYPALTCPTKTIPNIVADFDDLPPNDPLNHPYKHLTYINLTVEDGQHNPHYSALKPESKPNYAVSPFPTVQYQYVSELTIAGTKTTSFDFHSCYLGCLTLADNTTTTTKGNKTPKYTPIPCRVAVDCVTTVTPEGHQGPDLVTFDGGKDMVLVETEVFNYCQTFPIELVSSGVDFRKTVVVVDTFKYTVREGEVLPAFPGGPF